MTALVHMVQKGLHPKGVVRADGNGPVKGMIDRHQWNIGTDQIHHLIRIKINAGHHDSVNSAIPAMIIIAHLPAGILTNYKSDVIPLYLSCSPEMLQYMVEIVMSQSAHTFIKKEHSQIITPFCFKSTCG